MVLEVRLVAGLPTSGPLATPFPPQWGEGGREGKVVEFTTGTGTWTGNFRPGGGGMDLAAVHPDARHAVVVANGDLWVVDPEERTGVVLSTMVDAALPVEGPDGWVFRTFLALVRLGPQGLMWQTRRLSWDGIRDLEVDGNELRGLAYLPAVREDDQWLPFRVDLATGHATGGSWGLDANGRHAWRDSPAP